MYRYLFYFKNYWVCNLLFLLLLYSCQKVVSEDTKGPFLLDYSIDTSNIPNDTLDFSRSDVSFVNGLYLWKDIPFSGIIFKVSKGYDIKTYSSVLKGKLHGTYKSYYKNGKPCEVRHYRNNMALGKQYAYWKDTNHLKFEYHYYNEKKEGVQKSWYSDGSPYYVFNYKEDRQEGLQQTWRKNGSLYRNFVVKDGIRYGLQKTATCYELSAEEIK